METIKTEPEDPGGDNMDDDPLGLPSDYHLNFKTEVKVELVEESGTYHPPQGSEVQVKLEIQEDQMGHETYSSDNSGSSDSAPTVKRKRGFQRRKGYVSDEDYVAPSKKKGFSKLKKKQKDKLYVSRKYPSEIEDKVELITITEDQRVNEFTNTLSELKIKSRHRCELCALGFWTEKLLGLHNKLHDKKSGDMECEICHCYFKSKIGFQAHTRRHYLRYKCKECQLQFPSKDRALVHITETHDGRTFDCPHSGCGKSYKRPRDLQWHLGRHSGKTHQCFICSSVFKSKGLVDRHIQRCHSEIEEVSLPCPSCGRTFHSAAAMVKHRDSQHCTMDLDKTMDGSLTSDVKLTMRLTAIPCPHCELTFLTRRELVQHKNSAHAEIPDTRPEFVCVLCDRSYNSQSFLNGHIKRMHCNRVKRFECDHCHRLYFTKPEVRAHILWSHMSARGGFACACGRVFRARGQLRAHALTVHGAQPKEKGYQCGVCGSRFETNYLLKRHSQRHFNLTYPCPQCDMKFKDRNYVQIHYKLKHLNMTRAEINAEKTKRKPMTVDRCSQINTKISVEDVKALTGVQDVVITTAIETDAEKEFSCDQCPKIFKTNALLRRHSKIHSGTTYPCSECDMRFKDKRYVKVHYQLRHLNMTRADLKKSKGKEEVEKKFGCGECGKSFKTNSLLKRHLKIHAEATYPCSDCDAVFKNQSFVKIHHKIKHLNMTWDEAKQANRLEEMAQVTVKKEKQESDDEKDISESGKDKGGRENDVCGSKKDESGRKKDEIGSEKDESGSAKDESGSDDDDSESDDYSDSDDDSESGEDEKEKSSNEDEVNIPSTPKLNNLEKSNDLTDHEEVTEKKDSSSSTIDGNEIGNAICNTNIAVDIHVPTFDTFAELISDS